MTAPEAGLEARRSAAMVAFAVGDVIAGGYDGWSRPPAPAAVDVALNDPQPLPVTDRMTRLLATLHELSTDISTPVAARGQPPALSPGSTGSERSAGWATAMTDDIVVTGVASGLAWTSPARAAEVARSRTPIDEAPSPLAVGDAAGVIAAAMALAVTGRLPQRIETLADGLAVYAHTAEIRQELLRVAGFDHPLPATALRELGEDPAPVRLVGMVLLAASHRDALQAVRWAARTGGRPGPVAAAAGGLAAAREPVTIDAARRPGTEVAGQIDALAARLSTVERFSP